MTKKWRDIVCGALTLFGFIWLFAIAFMTMVSAFSDWPPGWVVGRAFLGFMAYIVMAALLAGAVYVAYRITEEQKDTPDA